VTADHVEPVIPPAEHDGVRDLIIIGSGPAGYAAAVYAARANLHPLVFEGSQFGGALMTTTEVENFPGFREGIQGPQLMDDMRGQAERFGAELEPRDVSEVDLTASPKVVKVGDEVHLAHAVIVATGSKYRYLGLANEERLLGRGVSACATCDGFFFRDQDIVVVGGGDSAMEEATFLTRFAKTVTVVHRRPELRASKIMQKRAQDNEKIRWALGKQVTDVFGETTVDGVEITDVRRNRPRPAQRALRRAAQAGRGRVHPGRAPHHPDQHRGRVRLR
jgi:thioredoxin reductase (NADPH)